MAIQFGNRMESLSSGELRPFAWFPFDTLLDTFSSRKQKHFPREIIIFF